MDVNAILNPLINRFYHENVQLEMDDAKKHRDIAFPNVEKMLNYMNKLDPRFGKEPLKVGSYWGGLKVDKADEFDYDIVLKVEGKFDWWNGNDRYYGFDKDITETLDTIRQDLDVVRSSTALPPPPQGYMYSSYPVGVWSKSDDLVRDGDIIPFLVKRQLKNLITSAIRDLNLRGEIHQSRRSRGPAITVSFKVGRRNISIDFAPVILKRLPFRDWLGWPRQAARWPDSDKIARIREIGINQVAKKEFYWMFSFAAAEKELVAGVDVDGGKRKELHRVMKTLNIDFWCPTTKPVISSYILKNIWFWELEKYPDGQNWDNDHVWVRLESMTRRLLQAIQTQQLPQYFQPAANLMDYNKDLVQSQATARRIQDFLCDPQRYLSEGLS